MLSIPPKITNEALEAYCHCPTKFHLKLRGERGVQSDYEIMRAELRSNARARALNRYCKDLAPSGDLRLTRARLQKASQYFFDGVYEDKDLKIHIDGIEKVPDASCARQYSFRPILFSGSIRTEKHQRMVLRVYGHALSTITDQQVHAGLVLNERDGHTKVPLVRGGDDFAIWLEQLFAARRTTTPPSLFLNDHCQICEFETRCRKQALDEGHLSLLNGMTPNEVAKYNAKGLFTVNQISYTFRARRKPKRARATTGPYYFSLQAQALREKKIFIHGSVGFRIAAPRIYFDIEGNPANGIDYLIGALSVEKDVLQYVSFWAGRDDERGRIFSDFLRYISTRPQHQLVHFGSYEIAAFRRGKSFLPYGLSSAIDEAISRSTNLLSVIRTRVYFPTYSNSLKEIGRFLGATWSHASPSGIQALVWRERWLQTNDPRGRAIAFESATAA
jgi:predicted RecB family nuclease